MFLFLFLFCFVLFVCLLFVWQTKVTPEELGKGIIPPLPKKKSDFYTVAGCDCVFHLYDFLFLLATLQRLISPPYLDRFRQHFFQVGPISLLSHLYY